MREFVEDQPRDVGTAVAQEGVEHRVAEIAERRVRRNAADEGVEALRAQFSGKCLGRFLVVETPVGDTADDEHAPLLRLQRKLRRGKDVPGDERPLQVSVGTVAVVIGQSEDAARELADFANLLQARPEIGVALRIVDDFGDRPRRQHHLDMAADRLRVIVETRTRRKQA